MSDTATAPTPLFDAAVLSEAAQPAAPYVLRPLQSDDFAKGHADVLGVLTSIEGLDAAVWARVFDELKAAGTTYVVVIEDTESGTVIGSSTLLLETKFIHGGATAGHIEDVVMSKAAQGKGLGRVLINGCLAIATARGAYKTILDCDPKVSGFYAKLGFEDKGMFMAVYADH